MARFCTTEALFVACWIADEVEATAAGVDIIRARSFLDCLKVLAVSLSIVAGALPLLR